MPIQLSEENDGKKLVVHVTGKLTKADYEMFVPAFDRLVGLHGKLRVLFDMTGFHGWEPGAAWEDFKFGVAHLAEMERLAMVGENRWEHGMAILCKPFLRGTVRYFDRSDAAQARRWLEGVPRIRPSAGTLDEPRLVHTASALLFGNKGLLAMDESVPTCDKRFAEYGIPQTIEARRAYLIPGIGPLVVAAPLVTWIVGALEGAVVTGGLSALGAALLSVGIPNDSILRYESAVGGGKFLVIVHGTAQETNHARRIIGGTHVESVDEHAISEKE